MNILDNLITLVSELVLTRNQLLQLGERLNDNQLKNSLTHLSFVTTELQEEIMKTRMQPIEVAWSKIPRQIRDLAKELGKKIKVEMHGSDTELDRQVLELIKDPLTHMIRNAADHGIELPHMRILSGKPEEGTLMLKAYHEGGNIVIEISDDGKGLDPIKLKEKILEKGLASFAELNNMQESQILNFIFAAGFSTAQTVTNVSGRGVGMDVVRTNIEKLGGFVELSSKLGKGTKFLIKIPLTLTIVSSLILECSGQKFAIPQASVTELMRVSSRSSSKIEYINNSAVLRLRNGTLPLISLAEQLGLTPTQQKDQYVICIHIDGSNFGIIVDRVFDTQEIVVKGLSRLLIRNKLFSGCTILGDGSVVLILDGHSLIGQVVKLTTADQTNANVKAVKGPLKNPMLLTFKIHHQIKAVPLILVARITEINRHELENLSGQFVYPYHGTALPILSADDNSVQSHLDWFDAHEKLQIPILIFRDMGRSMGLIIHEIIDILETPLHIDVAGQAHGSLGTCIINDQLSSIVDTEAYLKMAYPDWFNRAPNLAFSGSAYAPHVLIVDDNQFFRNLLQPLISVAGYKISMASSGYEALSMCANAEQYDMIISDIDMPEMTGFELVQQLKAQPKWQNTPIIALSALNYEINMQKGLDAGFNDCVQKSDHKGIIAALDKYREALQKTENITVI